MQDTPESPQPSETPQTPPPAPPAPSPGGPPAAIPPEVADYPLQADVERQEEYHRLLPLVKWLLVIPHLLVLILLGIGAMFAIFVSFFAVLFTRRYPRGLFDYVVGVHRWAWRVAAYYLLMTDEYPPFTLEDDPDYPARFEIDYPEDGVDRWRPLFAWLLAIPYLFVAYFVSSGRDLCSSPSSRSCSRRGTRRAFSTSS